MLEAQGSHGSQMDTSVSQKCARISTPTLTWCLWRGFHSQPGRLTSGAMMVVCRMQHIAGIGLSVDKLPHPAMDIKMLDLSPGRVRDFVYMEIGMMDADNSLPTS